MADSHQTHSGEVVLQIITYQRKCVTVYPPLHVTNAISLSEKGLSYKNTMNMKTFSIYNNDQRGVSWQLFCEYGEISGGSRGGARETRAPPYF